MASKRVLVTGAAGFVGTVLVRRLLADGHEVHVLLRDDTARWRLADIERDLRVEPGDLRDEGAVRAAVLATRPELVYHLAAHGAYPSQTDARAILEANVLGTQNLLAATADVDYEAFVNAGSSSEYGFKSTAMRESDVLEPNSHYAVAKAAQTLLCQYTARSQKRPITTLRLFSAYGPYEEPSRLVPTLIRHCLEGQDLFLADRQTARDFVYVDDVVDAFLAVDRLAQLSGEILNVGSGVQSTLGEVVDLVVRLTRAEVECHWGALSSRIWDTETWVADRSRSKQLLGWQPATPLPKGLARTITWIQEHGSFAKVA